MHHYNHPVPDGGMRFPFWRSHHSLLLLEKEKRGRKETCIRTCRKMQEVLGFSFTHSTILSHFTPRYCKLQSTQLLSPNLLCHPQRPAPNFHPVKQCKKKKSLFPEGGEFLWVEDLWDAGRMHRGWKRESLGQWNSISTFILRKQKILLVSGRE